jgi:hypothetical protein
MTGPGDFKRVHRHAPPKDRREGPSQGQLTDQTWDRRKPSEEETADIWGTSDQFNYVYQPTTADGTLVARVTSQSNTSSNAKAGIMFKESTSAGSPYFLIAAGPSGDIKVQYGFNGSIGEATYSFPNVWMKVTRVGDVFSSYLSSDGTNWTDVFHKTPAINSNATAGLFVCSHKSGVLGTATFDNVSYTPGP